MGQPAAELVRGARAVRRVARVVFLLLVWAFASDRVRAEVVNTWVQWEPVTSFPNSGSGDGYPFTYATSATGTLFDPKTNTTINVTYSGEVTNWSQFGSGNDFWGNQTGQFNSTYLSPSVTTLPTAATAIVVTGYASIVTQYTLTFDAPVTNLLMAIGSLGTPDQVSTYNFDRTAVVVSSGEGFFGEGPLSMATSTMLSGEEGNGMVQFTGSFSSLSWTIPNPEVYSYFNVGMSNTPAVPEPSTIAMAFAGLACGGVSMWRRRKLA